LHVLEQLHVDADTIGVAKRGADGRRGAEDRLDAARHGLSGREAAGTFDQGGLPQIDIRGAGD